MLKFVKANIHPQYYPNAKVRCACGNAFTVGSTMASMEVEICHACHPFYTGQEKLVDAAGRVERFRARLAKKMTLPAKTKKPRVSKNNTRGAKLVSRK